MIFILEILEDIIASALKLLFLKIEKIPLRFVYARRLNKGTFYKVVGDV